MQAVTSRLLVSDVPTMIRVLRAERDRLEADLEENETYRRLRGVADLLALYEGAGEKSGGRRGDTRSGQKTETLSERVDRVSLTSRVVEEVQRYLRETKTRAMTAEIVEMLQERGVPLSGKNINSNVSSMLSQSSLFDNVEKQGYGLKEWAEDAL